MAKLILGIDGGGTKTVARLARLHDNGEIELLGMGQSLGTNLTVESTPIIVERLSTTIDQAWASANIARTQLAALVCCLAGAGRAEQRRKVYEWGRRTRQSPRLLVTPDVLAPLTAVAPIGEALVLLVGTGAMAFARQPDGTYVRAGGWGPRVGDIGSGHWIGQRAVRHVLQTLEAPRQGNHGALSRALLKSCDCRSGAELLNHIHALNDPVRELASLAKIVLEIAPRSRAAARIIDEATVAWRGLVNRVMRQLDGANRPESRAIRWGAAGSVATMDPGRLNAIRYACSTDWGTLSQPVIVHDPTIGALQIARRCATEGPLPADLLTFHEDDKNSATDGNQDG